MTSPIIPTLAQRYDPAPKDDDRYETAIARRNTAWARWRDAADLLDRVDPDSLTRKYVIRNYNDCLDRYEQAADDLIREKVRWRNEGRPW